ncbi:MAG: nodulation protein NodH [Pseudomonadota bacterium]
MAAFDYFVVFAEMRTGSNFLEANLNALDGVACYGEAFNPNFIAYPNRTELLGLTKDERDANPLELLRAIRESNDQIGGFRYFHDHDPRLLETILSDRKCAKIILTRNAVDSYVSHKIAVATGQWKLTDVKRRRDVRIAFDDQEFESRLSILQGFQVDILNRMQKDGQTAFYLDYEDLRDLEVINGLAQFLGVSSRLPALDQSLKPQNPAPLEEKVTNFAEMQTALGISGHFDFSRTPNFEPRRGPAVPTYVVCDWPPLVYLPIRGSADEEVINWLSTIDASKTSGVREGLKQGELREWMKSHPGHRRFTVVSHPIERAHRVFCQRVLSRDDGGFHAIRKMLERQHKVTLSAGLLDISEHRAAFRAFLSFVKANLSGQTNIRIDLAWASQSQIIRGFSDFMPVDHIFREEELASDLPKILKRQDDPEAALDPQVRCERSDLLEQIYDDEIERFGRDAYQRDYMLLGFDRWR